MTKQNRRNPPCKKKRKKVEIFWHLALLGGIIVLKKALK